MYALEVFEGKLRVGGDFTKVGSLVNVRGVATWDGTSWADESNGLPLGAIGALEVYNSKIYATVFTSSYGSLQVYRKDPSGWTDITSDLPQRYEESFRQPLYAFNDGTTIKLIVGVMAEDCDLNRNKALFELATDGTWDSVTESGLDYDVPEDLIGYDRGNGKRLIVATRSSVVCNSSENPTSVWSIESGDWFALPYPQDDGCHQDFNALPFWALTMEIFRNTLYVGGGAIVAPPGCPDIDYIYSGNSDLTSWSRVGSPGAFNGHADGALRTHAAGACDWLIVGGGIADLNNDGLGYTSIAQWDGSSWNRIRGGIPGGDVLAMIQMGGWLYVGGSFSDADGNTVKNIARFRATADWNADGNVNSLDRIAFFNEWATQFQQGCTGNCSADVNGDEVVDSRDYLAFTNQFNACEE